MMKGKVILVLGVVLVLYMVAGAHLFQYLEQVPDEQEDATYNNFTQYLTDRYPNITVGQLSLVVDDVLTALSAGTISLRLNKTKKWNTAEAYFFVSTVVTTIGYGNVAPVTPLGRVMTIIYGILGIPLCLVFLAGLGEHIVQGFKAIERFVDCCPVDNDRALSACHMLRVTALVLAGWVTFVMIPAIVFTKVENWSYIDGVYFSFVTLSTIGFGDLVTTVGNPEWTSLYRIITVMWVYVGLAWLSSVISLIAEIVTLGIKKSQEVEKKIVQRVQKRFNNKSSVSPSSQENQTISQEKHIDSTNEESKHGLASKAYSVDNMQAVNYSEDNIEMKSISL